MKKIKALFYLQLALVTVLCLVCRFEHPPAVFAQSGYVNVVGTIPSYAGGQVTGSFVNQSDLPQLPLLDGSVFATTAIGNLDAGGHFSMTIADNTIIQPTPSQWKFILCWKTGNPSQPCYPIQITITCVNNSACVNGTLDISQAFAGAPIPGAPSLFPLWVDPRAYGAKCDGTNDDWQAIQLAVNAVAGTSLPVEWSGTCRTSKQIVLPSGPSGTCQWHLAGASVGARLQAMPGFPADTPMLYRPASSSVCGETSSIENLTIDANQTASQALTVQEQRTLTMTNVLIQDATGGSVGAETIFGISSGSAHLVGLHTQNVFIDNSNTIANGGAAARPNYGMMLYQNVNDSDEYNTVINHIKIAGIANHGDNNTFTLFHPWGYGPGGPVPNTWPQFGLQDSAFDTDVVAPEFDTVQFAGIDSIHGFIKVLGGKFVCNDGGDGSSCSPFVVQAESGASNLYLYGTLYQAGALSAPQSPINWLGTPDTATSTYVTQWGKAQIAGRSGLHLGTASNPTTLDSLVDNGTAKFLGGIFSNPVSAATSGTNVLPADTVNTASVWDGSGPVSASWNWRRFTSGVGIPSFDQYVITPPCGNAGYPGTGPCQFGVSNITVPTSANFSSPEIFMQGACQGCVANSSKWIWGQIYGTGANPSDTLNLFNDGGSSGAKSISALFDWSFNTTKARKILQSASGNFAGTCTMSAGSCSGNSFTPPFNSAPACTCSWTGTGTLTGAIKCPATASAVTPGSSVNTDTAQVAWACVGNPN